MADRVKGFFESLLSGLVARRPAVPVKMLNGPSGQKTVQTHRHHNPEFKGEDGVIWCDRCRNGDLLASQDPCACGRWG